MESRSDDGTRRFGSLSDDERRFAATRTTSSRSSIEQVDRHRLTMTDNTGIRIAIAGVGNCASSLIQGIHYYTPSGCSQGVTGLMHRQIGDYLPCDISVVAAFDVDARKVGLDVNRAIFAKPNCTKVFHKDIPDSGVVVHMGRSSTASPST